MFRFFKKTFVIGFMFILSLILFISKIISKDKLPMSFGYAFLSIETGSMEPTIEVDDVVIIKKIDPEAYKEDDIVAFWMNETDVIPTVHRIVKIEGNQVTTKGDNPINDNDPVHDINNLIGVEVLTIPKLGKFIDFVRSTEGIITIVAAGIVLIVVPDVVAGIINKVKNKNEEENITE